MPKRYPALDLGWLPVDLVNRTLGTELDPGRVRLSRRAHRHMAEDHPDDYPTCIAALPAAIAAPSYIGQAPHHGRNIEFVKRVRGRKSSMVLVAIGLEVDERGDYRVRLAYLIKEAALEHRRQTGRLFPAETMKGPAARPSLSVSERVANRDLLAAVAGG